VCSSNKKLIASFCFFSEIVELFVSVVLVGTVFGSSLSCFCLEFSSVNCEDVL